MVKTLSMASATENIKSFFNTSFENVKSVFTPKHKSPIKSPQARFGGGYLGNSRIIYPSNFDGEKNLGEAGPIRYYMMDYAALSIRSWQAYIESPIAQGVINKFTTWVIGKGLKLQSEPVKELIGESNENIKTFTKAIEAIWKVYSNSKKSDHSSRESLNWMANTAYKQAIIGGDVLVLLRYEMGTPTIQLVDGMHIESPRAGSEWWPQALANGNKIINGIETDVDGKHVAYYVRKPLDSLNPFGLLDYERVTAKGRKSGVLKAFMVYGLRYKTDNNRGIPILTAVIEKLKKLERYDEATLGAAEEQAKIAYQIVHQVGSTGEFPFAKSIAQAHDIDGLSPDIAYDNNGRGLTQQVMATTNKQVVNMPVSSEIRPMREAKSQLYYSDFLEKNTDVVCAVVEMPPNVAMSKYDSNYSASRAAIKDWEHTLNVKRIKFSEEFYQPIYNFLLDICILQNMVQAPGYLLARATKNWMVIEAYQCARFVGAPVANIDPVKEVEAERKKLGPTGDFIPLTTIEAATETLSGGDSEHNMQQFADELMDSRELGIRMEPEVTTSAQITDQ